MSAITGLDNRQPLPPYFPIERSEDRLFGIMLSALHPDVAVLDYPWAAPHLVMGERRKLGVRPSSQLSKSKLLTEWLLSGSNGFGGSAKQPGAQDVVSSVTRLASLSDSDLAELAEDLATNSATKDLVDTTDCLIRDKSAPESWISFVNEVRQYADRRLVELLSSNEHEQKLIVVEALQIWKTAMRQFADAISHWKEMLEI